MTTVTFDAIVSRLEKVTPYADYSMAVCVFHNDSDPSLMVFKDGWFSCLGCGRKGHWNTLWSKINGRQVVVIPEPVTSFRPPIYGGSNLEDICYQAHADLMQFHSLQWYLEMRGLENRIETNEIGYWQGWYTFPVRDREGVFQSAVLRAAPHVQKVSGIRYWCKSDPLPYVPDWHRTLHSKYLFVVYGILDALTLSSLSFPVITSTAGNNTFRWEWLDEFRRPIHIIPDLGEKQQALELASHLGWRGKVVDLNFPIGKKDANGFLEANAANDLVVQLSRYAQ
jgi:hypothetical protein